MHRRARPGLCRAGEDARPTTGKPSTQKRVARAFLANRRLRAVAGEHGHVVGQRQHFLADAAQQQFVVAAGQIGPANRPREKHVAREKLRPVRVVKTHAARAMPRHEQNLERQSRELRPLRLADQFPALDRLEIDAQPVPPVGHPVLQERDAVGMIIDRAAVRADERRGVVDVVDVRVREQQRVEPPALGAHPIRAAFRGVDEQPAAAGRFQGVGVGLEKTAGVNLDARHGWPINAFRPSRQGRKEPSTEATEAIPTCAAPPKTRGESNGSAVALSDVFMFSALLARKSLPFASRSMMKLSLSLAVGCSLLLSLPQSACRAADPEPGQIAVSVAKALEQLHYTRHQLDNSISDRLLHTYLETLDYNKQYFTQRDVDEFIKKYDTELDDDIWLGDLSPAYIIYDTYQKRVEDRVAKIKDALKNEKFDFHGHGSIEVSRQKSDWLKDDAAADAFWHDRIDQRTAFRKSR